MTKPDPIFDTRPDRVIALGNDEREAHGGWRAALIAKGFRMDGDNVAPPCRVRTFPGVAVQVEQWDRL